MRTRKLRPWIAAAVAVVALASAFVAGLGAIDGTPVDRATPASERHAERIEPPPGLAGLQPARPAPARPEPAIDSFDVLRPGDASETVTLGSEAPGRGSPDEAGDHVRDGLPLTAHHPLVAPVLAVQDRWTGSLLEHPLVVGTATGLNDAGDVAILVLAKAEIHDLPASLEGIPLEVVVTGEIHAFPATPLGKGPGNGGDDPDVDTTVRFDRPVPIGVSTGHPDITAGTIGCRVLDASGNRYALSNNHVYADVNLADLGDAVIQPGTYDGGASPADDIGQLADYEPIDFENGGNVMDAAIASLDGDTVGTSTPSDGYGEPLSTTLQAALNLRVMKYGRTTNQTTGRIRGLNATVNVGYGDAGVASFVGQILISPGGFSAGGDSGSLIVGQRDADARKPVALLFAGSSVSTIGSPIGPILTRFGVTIDGE